MPRDPFSLAYIDRTSLLHRLSFSSKLIWLLCTALLILLMGSIYHQIILYLFTTLFVFFFSKVKFREFIIPQLWLLPLWAPMGLVAAFLAPEQVQITGYAFSSMASVNILGLTIHYWPAGLTYGLLMYLRGMTICTAALALIWTTHPRDMVTSFTKTFRVPYKIAWSVYLALIYSPMLAYEMQVVRYAHSIRGLKVNVWNPFSSNMYKKFLFPVMIRGLRRAAISAIAMDSRAFGAYKDRTFTFESASGNMKNSRLFWLACLAISVSYFVLFWNTLNWNPGNILIR